MRFFGLLVLSALASCGPVDLPEPSQNTRSIEERAGTLFMPAPSFAAPIVTRIELPAAEGVDAIWGATGRDELGRIYVGLSSDGSERPTAYLYQIDPSTGVVRAQGDVLSELARQGIESQGQNKLHSKIQQANDGYLYFSSFDESGETDTKNPTWGGHLWRKHPDDKHWEHLLSTPEALIAVNTMGRYVYALGYWNHVLYRYDSETESVLKTEVGSVPGHVSRNFLVDANEHAYVPRVESALAEGSRAFLDQFDPDLQRVASLPLEAYGTTNMSANHGLVSYTPLRDGRIAFIVGKGQLYVLYPSLDGASLEYHGSMHPEGESAIESLFTFNGESFLTAVSRRPGSRKDWDWVVYEKNSRVSAAKPLDLDLGNSVLLYGSVTKDNSGEFFVAGRVKNSERKRLEPLLLRLAVPRAMPESSY